MTYSIQSRKGLPTEFQTLLADYPREAWPDHPNFAQAIQNWMGAHQMFRRLSDITTTETQKFLDKSRSAEEFAGRMGHFGNLLIHNLHGHHHWEDHEYFPELSAADPRFDHGLEMLEADHVELDKVLDGFTKTGNRLLKLLDMDEVQAKEEAHHLLEHSYSIQEFLNKHLHDEEDLVVPILLHHKLRG
jgi:hypothetical protein